MLSWWGRAKRVEALQRELLEAVKDCRDLLQGRNPGERTLWEGDVSERELEAREKTLQRMEFTREVKTDKTATEDAPLDQLQALEELK